MRCPFKVVDSTSHVSRSFEVKRNSPRLVPTSTSTVPGVYVLLWLIVSSLKLLFRLLSQACVSLQRQTAGCGWYFQCVREYRDLEENGCFRGPGRWSQRDEVRLFRGTG